MIVIKPSPGARNRFIVGYKESPNLFAVSLERESDSFPPSFLTIERIGEKSTTAHYRATQTESAIFLLVKQVMNKLNLMGVLPPNGQGNIRWIKKKMWKDGHITDNSRYYVREQRKGNGNQRMLAIHDPDYAIRSLSDSLRTEGSVRLTITDLSKENA